VKILILNGPNLSRLDLREQKHYGQMDYPQLKAAIEQKASELKIDVEIKQSDSDHSCPQTLLKIFKDL
jgi:3-dehydroquinate dehydratase-2